MRPFLALFFLLSVVRAEDSIEALGYRWTVQQSTDWSTAEPGILKLRISAEPPSGQPRRPQKFAIAQAGPFRKVTLEAEVRRNGRSLILVYAFQDPAHFDYAHISSDAASAQPFHNGMFHVFGGERVRISSLEGSPSLPTQDWTPVKLVFDGESGRCSVEVAGRRNPSLEAYDLSLRSGKVGLGSFDETGDFRKVRITGVPESGSK